MDLRGVAQARGDEDVSLWLKHARPGMLVGLDWAEDLNDDTEMELYNTPQLRPRAKNVNVTGTIRPRELGIVISVVQQEDDNRNVLVVFGTRMGWISSRWLRTWD